MTIRKRAGGVALGLVTVLLMGQLPLVAQEPAAPKLAAAPAKKRDPSHRVPRYFGQVGLTLEQRASIYDLRAKRYEKIDALEKQLKAAKLEMLADCETVLNETQKKLLDTLRTAAANPASKLSATPKPAEVVKPVELVKP